ncbi:MAG: acyl-CoA dehydrogenase family protein [Proteobacteria bacterium]|nr:acyl-CoA dehydrogenase family protein [Pseudomonadota bacterium]
MRINADIRDYLELNAVDREFIARAGEFAETHIKPHAGEWERSRQAGLPADIVRAWTETGLLCACVPERHGGGGASFLAKVGIAEVIARQCFVSSFALINLLNGPLRLVQNGTPDQLDRYLPGLMRGEKIIALALTEPQSGSDFGATATRAVRLDGGWRLTGEKAWVTHAAIGNLGIVYAQTAPEQGAKGIAAFLVDLRSDGCTVSAPYALETGSVAGVCGLTLKDCFVPANDVLMQPGDAFARALNSINAARTHVAAMCCGMVGEALALATDYSVSRNAFGRPLFDHQGLRWKLADVSADLESARLLTYRAAELIEQGRDAILAASTAKKVAVEMTTRCLPDCLQVMGANGLRSDVPIARHLLASRIAGFVDGTNEIQKERIGALLKPRRR